MCPKNPFPDWSVTANKNPSFCSSLDSSELGKNSFNLFLSSMIIQPLDFLKQTTRTKDFNHRTLIFFKRKKNPHSQVRTVREEAIIMGQCEKQEPLRQLLKVIHEPKSFFYSASRRFDTDLLKSQFPERVY